MSQSQTLQDYRKEELEVLINHCGEPKSVKDSAIAPAIDSSSMIAVVWLQETTSVLTFRFMESMNGE